MREVWYQFLFRLEMLWAAADAALILFVFSAFPLSFSTPMALPFEENAEFSVGLLTCLVLTGAFLNHLIVAVARRRVFHLDLCTSGFLARQMSVLLVAAQFDRRLPMWPLPQANARNATLRGVLAFFPGGGRAP